MIQYKINVLEELKKAGYNTYILRKKALLNESAIKNLRYQKLVNMENLNAICIMLKKSPADILEFSVTDQEKIKYY